MTIVDRANQNRPAAWSACPTHVVVVETPEGRLLWDTSVPRDWETRWAATGLQEFFPYDRVSEDEYFDSRLHQLGLGLEDIDVAVSLVGGEAPVDRRADRRHHGVRA